MTWVPETQSLINVPVPNDMPEHLGTPEDFATDLRQQCVKHRHVVLVNRTVWVMCLDPVLVEIQHEHRAIDAAQRYLLEDLNLKCIDAR